MVEEVVAGVLQEVEGALVQVAEAVEVVVGVSQEEAVVGLLQEEEVVLEAVSRVVAVRAFSLICLCRDISAFVGSGNFCSQGATGNKII